MTRIKKVALASFALASLAAVSLAPVVSAHEGTKRGDDKPLRGFEQRMQKREHKMENRLDKLVAEGKITQQQKEAITNKMKENHQKREDIRKIEDPEKRHEAMEQLHEDMKKWLQDQGIDTNLLKPAKQHRR